MLKLLGSVCVLSAAGLTVYDRLRQGRQELRLLQGISWALERMEGEIRLNRTPMLRLLQRMAALSGPESVFFRQAETAVQYGMTLSEAWRKAAGDLRLSSELRESVAVLGELLQGDEESACRGLRITRQTLQTAAEELRRQRPDRERKEAALWGTAGALLVILLI